jgi:hypothetical protein
MCAKKGVPRSRVRTLLFIQIHVYEFNPAPDYYLGIPLVLRLGMGNLRNMTKVVTTEQLYIHIQIVYNIYIGYIQLLIMHLDQIIFLK